MIQKFDDTWKKYSSGEIDDVLTNCRRILEELSAYLKRKGFKKRVEDENRPGKKKTVTDWEKFFSR
jgi:hypothetical protein